METEENKSQEIRRAFIEYAKENELPLFATPYYYAKQILPKEDLFFKMQVISDLIESGVMEMVNKKFALYE